ncbi:TDP-N-acetylfucosamine:lipid II N-acetylfucosaminyltransferase [Phocaeicola sp.]
MCAKVAHIVLDEKFIDTAIDIFTSLHSIDNYFLCYSYDEDVHLIKQKEKIKIFNRQKDIIRYINEGEFKVVFLHSKCLSSQEINSIHSDIKLIWISWGYDIYQPLKTKFYSRYLLNIALFKPLTCQCVYTIGFILKDVYTEFKSAIIGLLKFDFCQDSNFYKRVDYLSTVLPIEYEMINKVSNYRFKYFFFRYQRREDSFIQISQGDNILLGNSSAEENNHLDVLDILRNIDLRKRKIIMPISYGSSSQYTKMLKKHIKKMGIEDKIIFLENFMAYSDYCNVINNCRYAIFGHIRQQAVGNVTAMLRQGSKIFFFEESIVYQHLKRKGYYVYTIDNLTAESINTPLTNAEVEHNSSLLKKTFDYEKYLHELQQEIELVLKE